MIPTLYYSSGACSLAPHIVLEEIGAPFEMVPVSTSDRTTQSARYLRLNPKGRVPVRVTGASVLTEAPAILVHLALSNPQAGLLAGTPEALVRPVEWFNWLSGKVHAVAVRQVWRPETFTLEPAQHKDVVAKGRLNLEAAFQLVDARLRRGDWAVGSHYAVVDAYLLVFYRWGNRMGLSMREIYPAWTQHTLRVIERPAVLRALAREGISVWE